MNNKQQLLNYTKLDIILLMKPPADIDHLKSKLHEDIDVFDNVGAGQQSRTSHQQRVH